MREGVPAKHRDLSYRPQMLPDYVLSFGVDTNQWLNKLINYKR